MQYEMPALYRTVLYIDSSEARKVCREMYVHHLTLDLNGCTSSNAFPPTISVLRRIESIFPHQLQSLQVFTDGLRPIFPRSSLVFPFSFQSLVHHLFGSSILVHSGHMTQSCQ